MPHVWSLPERKHVSNDLHARVARVGTVGGLEALRGVYSALIQDLVPDAQTIMA